jgi:hypothetical protein
LNQPSPVHPRIRIRCIVRWHQAILDGRPAERRLTDIATHAEVRMTAIRRPASILVVLLLASAAATPLAAQSTELPTARLVAGGIGGSLVGAAVGGAVGWALYQASCSGYCEIGGVLAAVGAGLGATVGGPTGVHLANRRSGNLALSLLASAAVAAGSGALVYVISENVGSDATVNGSYVAAAAAAPLLQIAIAVRIERRTARRP